MINPIADAELGSSVRTKLNAAIALTNVQPEPLEDFFTDAPNVGVGADTELYITTIAGGKLANNGDKLEAEYSVALVDNGNDKRVFIEFDETLIFDTGLIGTSGANAFLHVRLVMIRVSNTVIRYTITSMPSGTYLTTSTTVVGELTGKDLSVANDLVLWGTAGGTDDAVAKMGRVAYIGAA